jgi:hypothetical protein
MKRLILALALLLICSSAHAQTFVNRTAGGYVVMGPRGTTNVNTTRICRSANHSVSETKIGTPFAAESMMASIADEL